MYKLNVSRHKFAKNNDIEMRNNHAECKNIFEIVLKNLRKLNAYNRRIVYEIMTNVKMKDLNKIRKLLLLLIPMEYFGNNKNVLVFARLCKKIMTSSRYERIYDVELYKNFDTSVMNWLTDKDDRQLLKNANRWLLDKVFKPLIRSCFKPVLYRDQMKLVKRSCWQSYQNQVVNRLISNGTLKRVYDVPKNNIKGYLIILPNDDLTVFKFKTRTSFAHNGTYVKSQLRNVSRRIIQYANGIKKYRRKDLFASWREFARNTRRQKIYAAKIDLENAYGNVDTELVLQYLHTANSSLITKRITKQVHDFVKGQYVSICNRIYLWQKGIIKGHPLSASICELFLVIKDNELNIDDTSENSLFLRNVDDYLYCSTYEEDVIKFINVLSMKHKLNNTKTETNVNESKLDRITYFGRTIQLDTKEISTSYNYDRPIEIRHRFKFTSYDKVKKDPFTLLEKSMKFAYNMYHFNKLVLNIEYNTPATFHMNFYDAMIYLAFKFAEAYACIKCMRPNPKSVIRIITNTICSYSRKAVHLSRKYKCDYSIVARDPLIFLGNEAFRKVFSQRFNIFFYFEPVPLYPKSLSWYCLKIPRKFDAIRKRRTLSNALVLS